MPQGLARAEGGRRGAEKGALINFRDPQNGWFIMDNRINYI